MKVHASMQRWLRSLAYRGWRRSLDDGLAGALRAIAEQEQRAEDEVAVEMLVVALGRRRSAELCLERWRKLSQREQEVTALVCLDLSNQEIAERLVLSPETVKSHMRRVLQKLDLHSKAELRLMYADWDFSRWFEMEKD
jgi:DNA-binding NarL/FixJ family response regulator